MRAPLVLATLSLGTGILAGLHRPVPSGWNGPILIALALALALAAAALSVPRRWRRPPATESSRARPGPPAPRRDGRSVLLLFLATGVLLGTAERSASERSCVGRLPEARAVRVAGRILDAGATGRLGVHLDSAELAGRWRPCSARVTARREGSGPGPTPGSTFEARGRWWSPAAARARLGRPGTLLLDSVRVTGTGSLPLGPRLRAVGRAGIDSVFTRRSSLAASLLLAQRDGLDPAIRDRYADAGLSHLLAISGLHVGLLTGIFLLVGGALRVGRRTAAVGAAVATVGYVVLIGAPYSALRAALQIVLLLAARLLQRPTRPEALIAAAALVLLALDPAAIVSPGFQLSFAGVAGILTFRRPLLSRMAPLARLRVGGRRAGRWLADGLATSTAATLATAPIVAWHFGRVPVIGVAANLIGIPLLAAVVPALALALTLGWAWLPAGRFMAAGAEALLDALDATATVAAALPHGTLPVARPAVLPATCAVVTGYLLSRRLGRVRLPVRTTAWAGLAGAVLLVAPLRPPPGGIELHHIDVGQGDATAIRSPGGRWLLIDAGVATDDYDAGASRVVPYLGFRGVRRLAGVVITHPDADHMGGVEAVLSALPTDWIGGPGVVVGKRRYHTLLVRARSAGLPWVRLRAGRRLELDGMIVTVLHPGSADGPPEDVNDASVVIRVVYGRFEALLTGDASASVERALVLRHGSALAADLLKVGHHGSSTSTSDDLLITTAARTAIISAGRSNPYGHPHPSVLSRLRHRRVKVYRTDRNGTIVVEGRADGTVRIRTERGTGG